MKLKICLDCLPKYAEMTKRSSKPESKLGICDICKRNKNVVKLDDYKKTNKEEKRYM